MTIPGTITAPAWWRSARPRADLDDPSVLPGDEAVLERRAVDREHPVGGDRLAHVSRAAALSRAARRSSSTESQIETS